MRRSTLLLSLLALELTLLLVAVGHAVLSPGAAAGREARRDLVRRLGLTDLALFTDARYTRHPTMADLNTPFQDAPLSMDHFPSGSLLGPPDHVRTYERLP